MRSKAGEYFNVDTGGVGSELDIADGTGLRLMTGGAVDDVEEERLDCEVAGVGGRSDGREADDAAATTGCGGAGRVTIRRISSASSPWFAQVMWYPRLRS